MKGIIKQLFISGVRAKRLLAFKQNVKLTLTYIIEENIELKKNCE